MLNLIEAELFPPRKPLPSAFLTDLIVCHDGTPNRDGGEFYLILIMW